MTKEKFIEFIIDLGFCSESNNNYYSLLTDVRTMSHTSFPDLLNITLNDEYRIAQLSLSHMDLNIISGKNFGNFSLKTFGNEVDFQLELFLSFISGSFNKVPDSITKYMRDKRIKDILGE